MLNLIKCLFTKVKMNNGLCPKCKSTLYLDTHLVNFVQVVRDDAKPIYRYELCCPDCGFKVVTRHFTIDT